MLFPKLAERIVSAALAWGLVLLFSGVASPRSFWRKVEVNHPGQICGVAMSTSGQHIVMSGDFDLHSSDGGVTWDTALLAPDIMDFGDEMHVFGVASGQDGTVSVRQSSDYGKTWERIPLPDNLINFNEVDFIDSVHGWAVGDKDFIVTTNDGWQTWTTKPYGLPGFSGGGVGFRDTLNGYVAGWLIGTDSAVLRTTDGGNSWLTLPIGVAASVSAFVIHFTDSLHGWLLASYGNGQHVFTSSDAGQTWLERSQPVNEYLWQLEPMDSLQCWMIGEAPNPFGPRVWKTTNGGQSWTTEYDGPGGSLLDLVMADTAHGIAVGSSGTVLLYGPPMLGDLNGDLQITGADVVLELNLVYLAQPPPPPVPDEAGDVNCDGQFAPADVVVLLNRAYVLTPFPCSL